MLRPVLLLFLFPIGALGQRSVNLQLFGGFSNYNGDLQEKRFTLNQSHAAVGAGLSCQLNDRVSLRTGFVYGRVSGDDRYSLRPLLRERNLSFSSSVTEGSLVADFSLLQDARLMPYLFAGLAGYYFNPYATDSLGRKVFLKPLGTEGQGLAAYPKRQPYHLFQMAVPFGTGIRFRITENAWLGYEIGLRKLFTDWLDDVSTTYADENELLVHRGPQAVSMAFRADERKDRERPYPPAGSTRGGAAAKDWYYFSGLTLSVGISDRKLFQQSSVGSGRRGSTACPRVL